MEHSEDKRPIAAEHAPLPLNRAEIVDLRAELQRELRIGEFSVALDGMNEESWKCFVQSVTNFARDLAMETARLEQAERDLQSNVPEVTSTMVRKALKKQRELPPELNRQPIPKWVYGIRITAFASAAAGGVIGAYLHSTLQWVAFTAVILIALFCNIFTIIGRVDDPGAQ